jgi:hypothetical protein
MFGPAREAHPASYKMGTGDFFSGHEVDHSPPSGAKVLRMVELHLYSPIYLHGVMRN